MIQYNFSAEFAALLIIITVLFSFSRDYDSPTMEYRVLKLTYWVALVSVIITITALWFGYPSDNPIRIAVGTVSNVLYFIIVPSGTLCYLIYAKLITSLKFKQHQYKKELCPVLMTYGLYLVVLFVSMACGKVFHISSELGYVRGDFYQLPYIIAVVNILWVAITVIKHAKTLSRDIINIMLSTVCMAIIVLYAQYNDPNTIMTGILNIMSVLGLHLYAQNMRKSTDQLTGVYNRLFLIHTLETLATRKDSFSLYVFSFRGMKAINTRYGIEFGDRVLQHISKVFLRSANERWVFRYSGDEFALVLSHSQKNHGEILHNLISQLEATMTIDGTEISMEMVYARVDFPLFGETVQDLISAADYSISSLKQQTKGQRYLYDTKVVSDLIRRSDMVEQLKAALESDRLDIHYQPIYSVKEGTFTQAEALVRMRGNGEFLIYPGDFINLAVKTGLIVPMTYLILEHVCRDLRHLIDTYGSALPLSAISVNFPYLQFTDDHMPQKVMAILRKYNISPAMIKIEITEREMVADSNSTKKIMVELIEHGFAFELDDFGMDYSNLSVVLELPLETIKLDRSLLLATSEKEENKAFFCHLATAISALGCIMVSEGVEDKYQHDFVSSCGCEYIQGYYFSKPLPLPQLQAFLEQALPYLAEKKSATPQR